MAFKAWTRLRDIARVRPDEIATREIRGYRVEYHKINAICVQQIYACLRKEMVVVSFYHHANSSPCHKISKHYYCQA